MSNPKPFASKPRWCWLVLVAGAFCWWPAPASAAFHLWNLAEIYTNSSGTLQFIELFTTSGSQQFVVNQQISVTNLAGTMTNTFTIPTNLPGNSANKSFLLGTAGIQAAGAPIPDYIIPNNFLFAAGGTINFFGANSGAYTALPTDGTLSRTWAGGNAVNTPTNFAGQAGTIVVPEPATVMGVTFAVMGLTACLRRRRSA
jgi:hypothetical protein